MTSRKTSNIALLCCVKKYFEFLNGLGVAHKCDRWTDGQMDERVAFKIAGSNICETRAKKQLYFPPLPVTKVLLGHVDCDPLSVVVVLSQTSI